ncbi:hypothetical protein PQX77_004994 [Marasmius sp. AFHP31]|nr:hypothetical protein PQX77_004994 [Marasmius sp. AFHP31]
MSKPSLDSDIYGDIYGDEEVSSVPTISQDEHDEQPEDDEGDDELEIVTQNEEGVAALSNKSITTNGTGTGKERGGSVEDNGSSASSRENSISYSAQVAQQFSAYQQTPSQERQQRSAGSSAATATKANGAQTGTAAIATLESSSNGEVVYGKKPSEMHDHG